MAHAVERFARGPGITKEEDKAGSTVVVEEEEEARHVIVVKMVNKEKSAALAYKKVDQEKVHDARSVAVA